MMKSLAGIVSLAIWIMGIIFAKGFWSTLFAVCIPFWAWYVAIEHFLTHFGLI